jgi:excisionase family DNA binding protein
MAELRVLTVGEVAKVLRISHQVVYRMIERGDLYSFRTGHQIRIPATAVDGLINGKNTKQPKPAHPPSTDSYAEGTVSV